MWSESTAVDDPSSHLTSQLDEVLGKGNDILPVPGWGKVQKSDGDVMSDYFPVLHCCAKPLRVNHWVVRT